MIKHQRAREEMWLRLPFNEIKKDMVEDVWERVKGLEGDDLAFNRWRGEMRGPAAEIRARFRQNKAVGSKSNPVKL